MPPYRQPLTTRQRTSDVRRAVHITMRYPLQTRVTVGNGTRHRVTWEQAVYTKGDRKQRPLWQWMMWHLSFLPRAKAHQILTHTYGRRIAARYR